MMMKKNSHAPNRQTKDSPIMDKQIHTSAGNIPGKPAAATLDRRDFLIAGVITLIFAVLVFYRIGNFRAPESSYTATAAQRDIVLDLGTDVEVGYISLFLGQLDNRTFTVSSFNAEHNMWELLNSEAKAGSVFAWNRIDVPYRLRHLGLVALDEESVINEMVIVTADGRTVVPVNAADYPALFDEQAVFEPVRTYLTGTMFDEVYHGRTAYEFIHGLTTYETTHPPLGKSLIALGIRLFGMNPFGWRFITALFGIMMVPLIYLFGRLLFAGRPAAAAVTVLLTVDCMHYTLSRIATIDIIAAFFILLMYYLMLRYFQHDRGVLPGRPYLALGLCGIVMGLAVATKWTGIYAGLGLGVLFFWYLINHIPDQVGRLIGFCLIFFVLLPALIYLFSYVPFVADPPTGDLLRTVIDNTQNIFRYHSELVATHYYSSPFYDWPLIKMPLLYATDTVSFSQVSSVSCMGNPFIWWTGIPCILFTMFMWLVKKDPKAGFLVIAYLAQYLPWFFIGRITFIYHYFPASLFMILMIGFCLERLSRGRWGRRAVYGYLLLAVITFIIFLPVISGLPAERDYQMKLRLLPEWILVL